MKALYPGSFDPITNGHIDIIQQALEIFDEVTLGIANNTEKSYLFDEKERLEMAREGLKFELKALGLKLASYGGLTIDYAENIKAGILVRGLRAVSDFDAEFQMTLFNRKKIGAVAKQGINTVFFIPDEKRVYLSSSAIKGIAKMGGDVSCFVPQIVVEYLNKKYNPINSEVYFDPEKCSGDPRYTQCRLNIKTCPLQHNLHGHITAGKDCPRLKLFKKDKK